MYRCTGPITHFLNIINDTLVGMEDLGFGNGYAVKVAISEE